MDKVIGLGKMGARIAEDLTKHPEYRIYTIVSESGDRASLSLGAQESMYGYEKNVDTNEIAVYLRSIKKEDQVLLIVEGGDPISGAVLKILETIQGCKINVLYICPERSMLSEIQKRDDKIAFNVLQEYARSGKFEKTYLIGKGMVESFMGDVPINEYENTVSNFISYLVAMINFFSHSKPIVSHKLELHPICRISTFGVSSLDDRSRDVLLFPLQGISDIHFYYGIPSQELGSDPTLMKGIKTHAKSYASEDISVSYSVHETTFDDRMILCTAYTKNIQKMLES